jgi:hypothetical protein
MRKVLIGLVLVVALSSVSVSAGAARPQWRFGLVTCMQYGTGVMCAASGGRYAVGVSTSWVTVVDLRTGRAVFDRGQGSGTDVFFGPSAFHQTRIGSATCESIDDGVSCRAVKGRYKYSTYEFDIWEHRVEVENALTGKGVFTRHGW